MAQLVIRVNSGKEIPAQAPASVTVNGQTYVPAEPERLGETEDKKDPDDGQNLAIEIEFK